MNERTLKTLEFNKIKKIVSSYAMSSLGQQLVDDMMPSTHMQEIIDYQNETTEAVELILKKGNIPLGGLSDISSSIQRADKGITLQLAELLRISDLLRLSRRVKDYIKSDNNDASYPIFEEMEESLTAFKRIEDAINKIIINGEEISDSASDKLYNIRRKIKDKNSNIKDKLSSMISSTTYQKYLQDPIITIRGDRYVIPVKQEFRANVPGLVHDQSSSGITLFIEPIAIVELNNDLKQLAMDEKEEIEKILLELTYLIGEQADFIKVNLEILATIDFISAKANFSLEYNCTSPKINNNGNINLIKARHPLISKDSVVPIDIYLGEQFRTLVVTGPNTGGKTVTLKTLGLLTLMAQSGLHIPVGDSSEIAIFDNVFVDIGDEQSIEQSLSTFSSHMTNIVSILNEDLYNSLVLFDELGAGTDPTEGAALAIAILEYLHKKNIRIVATTHYTELKTYALTKEGVSNACMEFNIETLRPTYKLLIGLPGKSNAFEISRKLGLPDNIINKAREELSEDNIVFEDIVTDLQEKLKQAKEELEETKKIKIETEKIKIDVETKSKKLQEQKDKIIKAAQNEALNLIKQAKEESELLILELKIAMEEQENKLRIEAIENVRNKSRKMQDEAETKLGAELFKKATHIPPKKVKIGDDVLIVNLNQRGRVASIPARDGNLVVQAGIMKINTNITQLQLMDDIQKTKRKVGNTSSISTQKAVNTKSEIDVRGQMLEEALMNVDKYIDDAYLANHGQVYIIHGKGTGVLRAGIIDFLKSNIHVKSYRTGGLGEGGTGVTVIILKE